MKSVGRPGLSAQTGDTALQQTLLSFVSVLRSHDLRISPAETLDAVAVASALGYSDREQLRAGLSLALAKTAAEKPVFDRCFGQFFDHRPTAIDAHAHSDSDEEAATQDPEHATDGAANDAGDTPGATAQPPGQNALESALATARGLAAFADSELRDLLQGDSDDALALAIHRAGREVGLQDIKLFTQKGQFTRRMLDSLGEADLRQAIIAAEAEAPAALPALRRLQDNLRERVKAHVEQQYLLHAEGHNQQFMDEILAGTRLSHIDHHYRQRVSGLIQRMARKLIARHARKRRVSRRGQLNMTRTLRRGIANDGLMFETFWRSRRARQPQLLAICDVSGSVAAYARFLLMFLYSLQEVLPRVRSYAFSSHLGEVSELFAQYPLEKAIELVNWKYGGATDYGRSLLDFASLALDDVNRQTTVIILGDARNNNADPELDILRNIQQRAHRVIWLNPESRRQWGTGDSEMLRYKVACDHVSECHNLRQLERFVDQLLRATTA